MLVRANYKNKKNPQKQLIPSLLCCQDSLLDGLLVAAATAKTLCSCTFYNLVKLILCVLQHATTSIVYVRFSSTLCLALVPVYLWQYIIYLQLFFCCIVQLNCMIGPQNLCLHFSRSIPYLKLRTYFCNCIIGLLWSSTVSLALYSTLLLSCFCLLLKLEFRLHDLWTPAFNEEFSQL